MYKSLMTLVLLPFLFSFFSCEGNNDVKIMTLNLRCDLPGDSLNAWPNRASLVAEFINEKKPDLMGFQEAMWHQYHYLDSALTGYGSILEGGRDGFKMGEANPVFYRTDRFRLISKGTFWLSSTPDLPASKGWDAAFPRTATWVKLSDKKTNHTLIFLNTHLDHKSDSARLMGAEVIIEKIMNIADKNDFVITGDFNATPGSPAVSKMTENNFTFDSYYASANGSEGITSTFNGWREDRENGRIDYIFVRNGMKVKSYEVNKIIRNNIFISDHWPVTVILTESTAKN